MNLRSAGIDGWPSKGCFCCCLVVNIIRVDMVFSLIFGGYDDT